MKAFIWDLDGTLLDSYKVIVSSLIDTYERYGIELDEEMVSKHVITYSCSAFIDMMVEKSGISAEDIKDRYSKISDDKRNDIDEIPHAKETLNELACTGAMHFVFTHRGESSEAVLKKLGLYDYFTEVITSKSGFPRKPEPDAIEYLIEKYVLDKQETYYVGDRTIDMDCAKNAGVKGILYFPEGSYCAPNGKETYIIKNLLEIKGLF